ncbi:PqqD family protein [Bradyrhizobium sp. McL0616]|uniref:PqqD family protein n=1 Tax=Bradyrhizobium sp. McL0616 TaxID=3415674 RepID=UPI003CE9C1B8
MAGEDDRYRKIGGFDQDEVVDGYIIYSQAKDRVHFLNPTAAIVLELCTGVLTALEIAEVVQRTFSLPQTPIGPVRDCLATLLSEGLIETCGTS